ncbi:DUF4902 domain-containing protein [Marinobacteraceae bacterium S3BR75-40.1]
MTNHYCSSSDSLTVNNTQSQLQLCQDGQVRLQWPVLKQIRLNHLLSGLDERDTLEPILEGARFSPITGFTEWVSDTRPALTLGWDWELSASYGQLECKRLNEPRTNIMLMDDNAHDLGRHETTRLLQAFVDSLNWQLPVLDMIDHHKT